MSEEPIEVGRIELSPAWPGYYIPNAWVMKDGDSERGVASWSNWLALARAIVEREEQRAFEARPVRDALHFFVPADKLPELWRQRIVAIFEKHKAEWQKKCSGNRMVFPIACTGECPFGEDAQKMLVKPFSTTRHEAVFEFPDTFIGIQHTSWIEHEVNT